MGSTLRVSAIIVLRSVKIINGKKMRKKRASPSADDQPRAVFPGRTKDSGVRDATGESPVATRTANSPTSR